MYLISFYYEYKPLLIGMGDNGMTERLVDVLNRGGNVLHTFPVTLADVGGTANDADFQAKGLAAAAHEHLAPDADLQTLSARMHVGRGGRMAPYGDDLDRDAETKLG